MQADEWRRESGKLQSPKYPAVLAFTKCHLRKKYGKIIYEIWRLFKTKSPKHSKNSSLICRKMLKSKMKKTDEKRGQMQICNKLAKLRIHLGTSIQAFMHIFEYLSLHIHFRAIKTSYTFLSILAFKYILTVAQKCSGPMEIQIHFRAFKPSYTFSSI